MRENKALCNRLKREGTVFSVGFVNAGNVDEVTPTPSGRYRPLLVPVPPFTFSVTVASVS